MLSETQLNEYHQIGEEVLFEGCSMTGHCENDLGQIIMDLVEEIKSLQPVK